jgi:hypothetical protein
VALAKELRGSLRKRSAELAARGYVTASGKPYSARAIKRKAPPQGRGSGNSQRTFTT